MTRDVLAIVGATATGKTALGEALATRLSGEVVCADSRQVFDALDIGTGKPDAASRARLPHHLFGARRLDERVSAGWYAAACGEVRDRLHAAGRRPILVGGSGLWLEAARRGLADEPPRDPAVRVRLAGELASHGAPALHARLATIDTATARRLHPNDAQRVLRALEVFETSGRPLSDWHAQQTAPSRGERWHLFELIVEANPLNRRIRERAEWMFAGGLLDETRAVVEAGHGDALRALAAIGYDEALAVLDDTISLTKAIKQTSLRTRQLAKRQRTWFRHHGDAVRLVADPFELGALVDGVCDTLRARGVAFVDGVSRVD